MEYLPVFLDVRDQPCLLVGGGEVAVRKSRLLLRAGAKLLVVAPELHPELDEALQQGEVEWLARPFQSNDVEGARFVVAASDDEVVNAEVSRLAQAKAIPVNVVDNKSLCSAIMPSIVDRSPITVTISSAGYAPVLARLLRERIEAALPASLGPLATLAGKFRAQVQTKLPTVTARRGFWERVLDGPPADLMAAGREDDARQAIASLLDTTNEADTRGEVYLVGAGPGDPDLLTFRALRLMQRADVVLYDRLVSAEVLDLVRRDAERVYVGKARANHAMRQRDINQTLLDYAREGLKVLRLKGGDPFIFGRGGEEIETLAEHNIPFQVVPGITAAAGCAAFAGIPLTHRDHAQSCTFATGHLQDGTINLDWHRLAQPGQTLVFYMGLTGLTIICEQLSTHGLPSNTPAALIQQGTTANQKVLIGTLESLPQMVERERPTPPTLLVIGTVVSLREKLSWFGTEASEHTSASSQVLYMGEST